MHSEQGCDKKVATELPTSLHPRLLALEGPLKDSTITLPEGEITLGRDPTNAVPLNDPSVSRKHCVFLREQERLQVRDLESRNGTVVNEKIPSRARFSILPSGYLVAPAKRASRAYLNPNCR